MTRAAALKAWVTRRARAAVQQHPDAQPDAKVLPLAGIEPGRLQRYPALHSGTLFQLLREEQRILERFANHPARAGWIRNVEGSGVGAVAVLAGGSFAGGRATRMAEYTARRIHRIEGELEARGFDRATLEAHRFGSEDEQDHREGMILDSGDQCFETEDIA